MKRIALGLVLIGSASVVPVHAADSNGMFNVQGLGNHSCGKFIEAANQANNQSNWSSWNNYASYTAGYITGLNEYLNSTHDLMRSTDMDGVMAYIEKFCRENPLEDFHDGLQALTTELYPKRKQ
ncbi:hypothetical protein E8F11_06305 [Pseudomonas sp. BN417]|uniref:hypothetical protein n=1 Tax=Pseudomonas sp. BN417 TaxID=2567890 RepID=UPI002453BF68|nr:hypothetical protein [Pseudomonas sp. BN417]MDH4554791.1 hypothetical protein [Pseudomonas sp. BN417]